MTGRVIRPFERADAPASAAILNEIIACIRADNAVGLGYCRAMGFMEQDRLRAVPLACGRPVDRIVMQFGLPAS